MGSLLRADGTLLKPIGGVNQFMGGKLLVTEDSPLSMNVRVASGICWVQGTENATQGGYSVMNDGTVLVTLDAAHATLARIDLVVVRIQDSQYSGGSNTATIEKVTGTPAGSPTVPTAPANSLILAQIAVAAAVTTINNSNITDRRVFLLDANEIRKTADESIASLGSLQDDDQLSLTVNALNLRFRLELFLRYNSPAAAGIQIGFTGPTGAAITWLDVFGRTPVNALATGFSLGTTTGAEQGAYIVGTFLMGTTPGKLTLQWGQQASNASSTFVRANSWLRLTPIL